MPVESLLFFRFLTNYFYVVRISFTSPLFFVPYFSLVFPSISFPHCTFSSTIFFSLVGSFTKRCSIIKWDNYENTATAAPLQWNERMNYIFSMFNLPEEERHRTETQKWIAKRMWESRRVRERWIRSERESLKLCKLSH